ncbi:AAA family ATPase [Anaerofilum sp. BX8]|uniref:AAA family ATPase n=1 Tax=Anaerofilum hominis TaxID=2763016 RepID=A0A923I8W4_9FIRM|nr:AAA family ATPase [Anaerofilum hominis]MBC5582019.1 AAA family ATPase [Anaerofilum hominis]
MAAIWIPKRLVEIGLVNTAAENPESFISHCEIEYQSRVEAAAREVLVQRRSIVMLTGPSASGKTTTAHKLADCIRRNGSYSCVISLDNFFKNLEDYPRLPDGSKDYENVEAIDVPLVNRCLAELLQTGHTRIPDFDFLSERRKEEWLDLDLNGGVVVVEGIHALNPALTASLPRSKVYKIYAGLREEYSYRGQRVLPTRDIRLARRMVRDYKFRGHSLEKTLGMWDNVCIGEDQFIKVFKPEADLLLDTSFSYEICCLAPSVTPLAGKLPENSPYAERLYQLAGAFSLCTPIDDGLIPADSMLQEFLGE